MKRVENELRLCLAKGDTDRTWSIPATTGGKIDQSWVVQQFPRFLEKSGIADCRFHDLRHTFGTRLAQAGVDLYLIMKLMGHRDIRSTMRYMHHNTESLRRGISVLDAGHNLDTIALVRWWAVPSR